MRAHPLRVSVLFVLFVLSIIAPQYALANTVDFSGTGIVGPLCSDPNPFGCLGVVPGENMYRFGSEADWQLDSLFAFDFMPPPGIPNGVGTFRFFNTGVDEISGSLETFLFPPPNPGLPPFIELQVHGHGRARALRWRHRHWELEHPAAVRPHGQSPRSLLRRWAFLQRRRPIQPHGSGAWQPEFVFVGARARGNRAASHSATACWARTAVRPSRASRSRSGRDAPARLM